MSVESTLQGFRFPGTYTVQENRLTYTFHPPELQQPVTQELGFRLQDRGQALVLIHETTEYVYYHPERLAANLIYGEWVGSTSSSHEYLRLGKDGAFRLGDDDQAIQGYYRLWRSNYGDTMTADVFIPDHGCFMLLWRYARKGDELTLTPITSAGLGHDHSMVLHRKKDANTTMPAGGPPSE
jgi:hypothetical protein